MGSEGMASPLKLVQLWGGAAEIAVPKLMNDMSDIRPVPDNQEASLCAWLDSSWLSIQCTVECLLLCDSFEVLHCTSSVSRHEQSSQLRSAHSCLQVYIDSDSGQALVIEIVVRGPSNWNSKRHTSTHKHTCTL